MSRQRETWLPEGRRGGDEGLQESEGDRIKFIVNLGDSFYCNGVGGNDDYRWAQFWTDFYDDEDASRHLVKLPWYEAQRRTRSGKCHEIQRLEC